MTPRTPHRPQQRALSRKGLTLIELMITMVLVSFAITGAYAVLGTSTEVFNQQELASENQSNLRFATQMVKQDLGLAGYHSTPNSDTDPWVCPKPAVSINAISLSEEGLTVPGAHENIDHHSLTIIGDFSGNSPLRISTVGSLTTITISQTSLFDLIGSGATETAASELLDQIVKAGQWLSIVNPDGYMQFVQVDSVDTATLQITLDGATPLTRATGNSCGLMGRVDQLHEVYPIKALRYTLALDPIDDAQSNLVREEVDLQTGAAIDGYTLVVSNFVVGLDFAALGVDALTRTSVPLESDDALIALDPQSSDSGVIDFNNLDTTSQRIRFLVYRLRTRTNRAVPRRLAVPSSALADNDAQYTYFQLSANDIAEVRTLQGKIRLPNLLLRDLQ